MRYFIVKEKNKNINEISINYFLHERKGILKHIFQKLEKFKFRAKYYEKIDLNDYEVVEVEIIEKRTFPLEGIKELIDEK